MPIAYTSGSFSDMQQRWSATEKEAIEVYQLVLKFNFYLRGAQCILHCDHKPMESVLSCGMKIPKLDHWLVELTDYDLTFVYIRGTGNILADTRLKTLDIYIEPLENPKTAASNNTEECITQVVANKIQTFKYR